MSQRAHKIALDPTEKQIAYFGQACGVSRFTYNWALDAWKKQYEVGEKPNGRSLKKKFNAIKYIDFPWTGDVLRDATAQPFANLQAAFQGFFRRKSKFPGFKKKGIHDSFYIANDKFETVGMKIRIPKLGWVKMHEALRFNGKILSAVVSRTADKWFVSISVELPDQLTICENQEVVGVDLGIKTLATLSTGEKFEAPKPLVRNMDRLRRLNRQLSRKQKGSQNRKKAQMNLTRLYYRISCVRQDALHKLTTELVKRFGTIVIEDLNVSGMVKNRHLSRAISDVGFYEFKRQLGYKAISSGVKVIVANRWFPSSKTCSYCGFKLDILPLSIREWTCPECGVVHDRDENAAINLKQLGQTMSEVTPVDKKALIGFSEPMKPSWMKQELYHEHFCSQER